MAFDGNTCPIWGAEFKAHVQISQHCDEVIVDCSRCGGKYCIDGLVNLGVLTLQENARLTTWLVDRRIQGDLCPTVEPGVIEFIRNKTQLAAHVRADRLLRLMAERTETVGRIHDFRKGIEPEVYAWTESTSELEVGYFIDYLLKKGWLGANPGVVKRLIGNSLVPAVVTVTVEGYGHIGEQIANADSTQAFIAMWFDDSMEAASRDGIEPAIVDAGYTPMRIDKKLDVRKIDDEIVAQIRRSRFLVADCTHGETKSRGSVYWEAGFAYGLGIEVIYTCRKDEASDLPFDTRQYPYIIWDTVADLRLQLKERISARIGDGPRAQGIW